MPHWSYVAHPDGTTREEFYKILELRRECINEATKLANLGEPLPITWRRGWSCHQRLLGRDQDGSLRVAFVVVGPRGEAPYKRNVRLVARKPLPYELGQG